MNNRTIRRVPLFFLAFAPAFASSLAWVASNSAEANNAIQTTNGRLCRAAIAPGGDVLFGFENKVECEIAAGGAQVVRPTTYEVATGFATWQNAAPLNTLPVAGGIQGGNAVRPCLTRGPQRRLGWNRVIDDTCHFAAIGSVPGATAQFDLLFELNLTEPFHVIDNDGYCVTAQVTPNVYTVLKAVCGPSAWQQWRLDSAPSAGQYKFRNLMRGDCLTAATGTATTMAPCAAGEASIRPEYVNELKFRLRFANGNYGEGGRPTISNLFLRQTASSPSSPTQRFTIRNVSDSARRLDIMTYNIMMLGGAVFPGIKHTDRVNWLVQQITSQRPHTDVFVFQEAFDEIARGRLQKQLSDAGYPYFSELPFAPLLDDAGVYIQSRYPIETSSVIPFPSNMCDGADCLAAKGVAYARINKLGRRYHVFGTHLQAGADSAATRRQQLTQMRHYRNLMGILPGEPVLMAGDFNIDMENDVSNYNHMLNTLEASFPLAPRSPGAGGPLPSLYTADYITNDIKRARGGTSREWLDYILTANSGPAPVSAEWEVKEYEHHTQYGMNLKEAPALLPAAALLAYLIPSSYHVDLSDHTSVRALMSFPYGALSSVEDNTVPVTFEAKLRSGGNDGLETELLVRGSRYPLPVTLRLQKDQMYDIGIAARALATEGTRHQWHSWSNGAQQQWTLAYPTQEALHVAYFDTQYQLAITPSPAVGGSTSGSGWYAGDTAVDINATAATGFRFTGYSGGLSSTRPAERIRMNKPYNIVANFAPVGMPTLFASPGARTGTGISRSLEVVLKNAGQIAAANARVVNVTPQVVEGSGAIFATQALPLSYGGIAAGGAASQTIAFQWPVTAIRVRFTVQFAADGGYTGSTVFTVYR